MKQTTTLSYILVTLVLIFTLGACNNTTKTKTVSPDSAKVDAANIEAAIRKVVYPLPSVKEVTDMLIEIKAEYMIGLANDPLNAEKYAMETSQAINLGIYGADLSYASTYKQQNAVTSYVKACETLIKSLDITSSFGSDILNRVESNLDNKAALTKEISDIFQYTYGSLQREKKPELAALILTGSWVEGMYLTTAISENTAQNPKIVSTLLFQEQSFYVLLKNIDQYKDSPLCKDVYANLLEVDAIFKQNPDANSSVTKKELEDLSKKIAEIRTNLVKL